MPGSDKSDGENGRLRGQENGNVREEPPNVRFNRPTVHRLCTDCVHSAAVYIFNISLFVRLFSAYCEDACSSSFLKYVF